jgi:site-specific DNA-methyltransferase (adenine-specific)
VKLYNENKNYKLYQGNMLDMLEVIEPNTIDSIVTDPPYELNFMGKGWDNAGVSFNKDTWKKCFDVLKEGGYLLAFGGSRTYHRIAVAIEDAGFEIRDTIMWLYGSGFPKSMNIGLAIDKKNGVESKVVGTNPNYRPNSGKKGYLGETTFRQTEGMAYKKEASNKWQGWGSCLKPSFEPIIVARKPFKGSLVDNVIENGVGGINIDECRVEIDMQNDPGLRKSKAINTTTSFFGNERGKELGMRERHNPAGRFPANTILTYDENDFDEVCGGFPNTKTGWTNKDITKTKENIVVDFKNKVGFTGNHYNDSGSASRYFYCAKASKKDRDEGLEEFKNTHPTVKPTELMQYLVRLVTPNGGTILDPFNGSGSTGKAVMYENKERNKGYKYIGIELTEEYLPIAQARIEYASNLKEEEKPQTTIFDYIGDSNE